MPARICYNEANIECRYLFSSNHFPYPMIDIQMSEAMNKRSTLFLDALRASLLDSSVDWTEEQQISQQDWARLFQLADTHQILPMIFEAVYSCPAANLTAPADAAPPSSSADPAAILTTPASSAAPPAPALIAACRQNVQRAVIMQSIRTQEAVRLLSFLEGKPAPPRCQRHRLPKSVPQA